MTTIHTQALLIAHRLRHHSEEAITNQLNKDIRKAFTLTDPMMALDFNARLITELRTQHIWPDQYTTPADPDTPT